MSIHSTSAVLWGQFKCDRVMSKKGVREHTTDNGILYTRKIPTLYCCCEYKLTIGSTLKKKSPITSQGCYEVKYVAEVKTAELIHSSKRACHR